MPNHLPSVLTAGALGLCAAFAATAALATQEPPKVVMKPPQDAAPTRVAPVTVEATKPAELKQQTYSFVQTYAATTVNLDQLARWTQPVCVTVQGLPDAADAEVKARVEEVATALKVGAGKAGCQPNIQVVFSDQPQAFMDKVAAQHEFLLGYWHHRDRDKLKVVSHPVQAWYLTGTGGDGGNTNGEAFASRSIGEITAVKPGTMGRQPHGFQYDDEENAWFGSAGCGDKARFTACLTSELQHVLVVVDTNRVQTYSPGLIADYVVMVALAQPKSLDACNVLASVIDLFSKDCPGRSGEVGLTRADVAYLTALYKTDLQARKAGQITDIAGRMADMLLKASAADRLATFGAK